MAKRSEVNKSLHDWVIKESAKTWEKKHDKVITNPGQEKNGSIKGYYPDIIVIDNDYAEAIEEIETSDSVNDKELEQWVKYATIAVSTFHLGVPFGKMNEAHKLLESKNIRKKIYLEGWAKSGNKVEWVGHQDNL